MYCKNCEKEIEGNFIFCPHCGNSIQQEIIPSEGENEYSKNEYLKNEYSEDEYSEKEYKNKLKSLKKEYRRKKIKRISMYVNAFILFNFIIQCGLSFINIEEEIYNQEYSKYDLQLNEYESQKAELENELEIRKMEQAKRIEQEKKIELANYEMELENTILQSRGEQVKSCLVSPENMAEVDEYIKSLYRYSESKLEQISFNDESYYIFKNYIELDKYNLLDSTNNAIYPGAILKGDSLFKGNYTVIPVERTPIVLMSNQSNGKAKTVLEPNYSNISYKLNEFANEYVGDVSKEWKYELVSASSSQELNAKLGASVGKHSLGVNTNFSNEKNKMAVVYSQIYYTVSVEPKSYGGDYFDNGVNLDILGEYEPAYVSSVDYGRKFILIVESKLSESELRSKLETNIKGVNIESDIERIDEESDLSWEIESYGGEYIKLKDSDMDSGFSISDALNDTLNNDNKLINPVPISYNLKYLSDNAPVPPMYINSEEIKRAEDVQMVILSSEKEFAIDITSLRAILLNENEVQYKNGKPVGTYFELICSNSGSLPMDIIYRDDPYRIDLASYEMEKKIPDNVGSWLRNIDFYVYRTIYLK